MFRSLSRCTPNSPVTLAFTSSKTQYFDIWSNVTVSINSTVTNTRPILITSGDQVEVSITTPSAYLGYAFYPYTLDTLPYSFAVVNRNNFTPTVKSSDARKRWYNYVITNYTISFPFDFTEQEIYEAQMEAAEEAADEDWEQIEADLYAGVFDEYPE